MNATAVGALVTALGDGIVTLPEDLGGRRLADWSKLPAGRPAALIEPRDTSDIVNTLAICRTHDLPIVVQGGLTGLAGAATVLNGEVVISLQRMTRIEELDSISATMTVQAGVTLAAVQDAALEADLYFPLDLGSRGSCTIGGTIATNAGGNRVIKYGMMREQLLGLEVVLADGRIISDLHKMLKNNTGYHLGGLFVGSEGTLGVITRAVLRLRPRPGSVSTAFCGLADYSAVTALLRKAQASLSAGVSAFEVMWPDFYDLVLGETTTLRRPLAEAHAFYVLLESEGPTGDKQSEQFESFLAQALEDGIIKDAAIATSERDALDFWAVREGLSGLGGVFSHGRAFDISFAVCDVAEAAKCISARIGARFPGAATVRYGHLGDGNIHFAVNLPSAEIAVAFEADKIVYDVVAEFGGSTSAEHGIGLKRRNALSYARTPDELSTMAAIKGALDPDNILGRGRIFAT